MVSLEFTRFDMTGLGSASPLFAEGVDRTGIYVLEFADGARYVGQTVDVVQRFAAHRRHHGDVVALSFASCPRELLDVAEREVVRDQEQRYPLRNVLLTGLPGGPGDVSWSLEDGPDLVLPWERGRRARVGDSIEPSRRKCWALQARDDWQALGEVLAAYVDETIPDPLATAGQLWTVSALPSTRKYSGDFRLVTVNCGRLETLFVRVVDVDGEPVVVAHLNLVLEEGEAEAIVEFLDGINAPWEAVESGYRAEPDVTQVIVEDWPSILRALECPELLDACHRLNVRLMRRGVSLFRRTHNAWLAGQILNQIGVRAVT